MKFFNYELIDKRITIDNMTFEFVCSSGITIDNRILLVYLLNGMKDLNRKKAIFIGALNKEEFDEDNILCIEALKNMKEYCEKEYEEMFYMYLIL